MASTSLLRLSSRSGLAVAIACASTSAVAQSPTARELADRQLQPRLNGLLAYQRQTPKDSHGNAPEDARLWVYDFKRGGAAICLNEVWAKTLGRNLPLNLHHTINPHFSPDGKTIIFAGIWGIAPQDEWDVFACAPDGSKFRNLTGPDPKRHRDEDPKFSPNGKKIVYKHNFQVSVMDKNGANSAAVPISPAVAERSMPYFSADGLWLLFAEGKGELSDLYRCRVNGRNREAVAATPGLEENYPIAWTGGRILFNRWAAVGDPRVQIYWWKDGKVEPLPTAVNSPNAQAADPFPLNAKTLLFSGTRASGSGGLDLYLADIVADRAWSLSDLAPQAGINTALDEFGVAYRPR